MLRSILLHSEPGVEITNILCHASAVATYRVYRPKALWHPHGQSSVQLRRASNSRLRLDSSARDAPTVMPIPNTPPARTSRPTVFSIVQSLITARYQTIALPITSATAMLKTPSQPPLRHILQAYLIRRRCRRSRARPRSSRASCALVCERHNALSLYVRGFCLLQSGRLAPGRSHPVALRHVFLYNIAKTHSERKST